ncbi:MAG: isochorismatase hydrolase [Labilithrix sp.]|nr:isochorismatase hydrolase [Labilithrix sp.]
MTARGRDDVPPERGPCVLLLVDVINDLEFEGGEKLLRHALPAAKRLAALVQRARRARVPVIYANDNFGHWRSDFQAIVRHCLDEDVRGRPIAQLLAPAQSDYFVLKPKHSAFFSTALDTLLRSLGTRTIILAGLAGDICVLFTAHDAHMREYELFVPSDCIASESVASNRWALEHMRRFLRVDTRIAQRVDFRGIARGRTKRR